MRYTQGWLLGVEDEIRTFRVPFEMTMESGHTGISASGACCEDLEREMRFIDTAVRLTLNSLFIESGSNHIHLHLPIENLRSIGTSYRLSLAYALMNLYLNDFKSAPHRVAVTGNFLLNGKVLPVKYLDVKSSAATDLDLFICPDDEFNNSLEIPTKRVRSLRDLAGPDLRTGRFSLIPQELRAN